MKSIATHLCETYWSQFILQVELQGEVLEGSLGKF